MMNGTGILWGEEYQILRSVDFHPVREHLILCLAIIVAGTTLRRADVLDGFRGATGLTQVSDAESSDPWKHKIAEDHEHQDGTLPR